MSELDPVTNLTTERVRRRTFLKEWRKHRKLTLEVASRRAGMTAGNLSAMERRPQGYTQAGLEALALTYECEPSHLLAIDPSGDAERLDDETQKPQFLPTFVRQWREYRNLTQDQLSDLTDLTQSHLSMLERGLRGYNQNTLHAIAVALQVDAGQLLTVHPMINSDLTVEPVPERTLQPTFIRQWRNYRGKTLSQVADDVNTTHATISRIETGKSPYSQPMLEAIAESLGTDAASLLSARAVDCDAIWSIWDKAQPFERELIVNVAYAILKTRKGD